MISIVHSNVSPAESPRKTVMPSGTVHLKLFDFGRAMLVFDLRLMSWFLRFYVCSGAIYFYLCVGRGVYIWFLAS